jgi:hypothetical protein
MHIKTNSNTTEKTVVLRLRYDLRLVEDRQKQSSKTRGDGGHHAALQRVHEAKRRVGLNHIQSSHSQRKS